MRFEKDLNGGVLCALKRSYAWERNHSITRLRMEQEAEQAARDAAAKKKRVDAGLEGYDEAMLEHRKKVQFGYGETRNEREPK